MKGCCTQVNTPDHPLDACVHQQADAALRPVPELYPVGTLISSMVTYSL